MLEAGLEFCCFCCRFNFQCSLITMHFAFILGEWHPVFRIHFVYDLCLYTVAVRLGRVYLQYCAWFALLVCPCLLLEYITIRRIRSHQLCFSFIAEPYFRLFNDNDMFFMYYSKTTEIEHSTPFGVQCVEGGASEILGSFQFLFLVYVFMWTLLSNKSSFKFLNTISAKKNVFYYTHVTLQGSSTLINSYHVFGWCASKVG